MVLIRKITHRNKPKEVDQKTQETHNKIIATLKNIMKNTVMTSLTTTTRTGALTNSPDRYMRVRNIGVQTPLNKHPKATIWATDINMPSLNYTRQNHTQWAQKPIIPREKTGISSRLTNITKTMFQRRRWRLSLRWM